MQNIVNWNSFGFEEVARSLFLFLARLGRGARANNKDFGLATVLQGGVSKAITDLA